MPVVEREDGLGGEEATTENQTGTKPARRFLTRTAAAGRQKQEASLATAIRAMELDLDPENVSVHEVLLHQMLENLEREHNMYVVTESLDVNIEPVKSYMLEIEGKQSNEKAKNQATDSSSIQSAKSAKRFANREHRIQADGG